MEIAVVLWVSAGVGVLADVRPAHSLLEAILILLFWPVVLVFSLIALLRSPT